MYVNCGFMQWGVVDSAECLGCMYVSYCLMQQWRVANSECLRHMYVHCLMQEFEEMTVVPISELLFEVLSSLFDV